MRGINLLIFVLGSILIVGCIHTVKTTKQEDMHKAIRLKSRVFVPVDGLEKNLLKHVESLKKLERIHVLVQFTEVPDIENRRNLEQKMNLRFLDPIPEKAFYISIPTKTSIAKSLVDLKQVRWIGKIQPRDKVKPWLIRKGVPQHARRDRDSAELIVEFFGDISEKRQQQVLKKHGVKILERITPINGWSIIIKEATILSLADKDEIKWIVDIPGPPEDDNDGIRSGTGVNSDPVYAPSVYNLSGAGTVVAQWESTHATFAHNDYSARINIGDPPLVTWERPIIHDETVAANGQFDNGENIYWDMDENTSVSAGDVRATPVAAFAALSTVAAADADVGNALTTFILNEWYGDTVNDGVFTNGEGIYLDNDLSRNVSTGDTRIIAVGAFAAGSVVNAGPPADADIGTDLDWFDPAPHDHSSHVAGTVLGSGGQSVATGGTPNQWQGVAPAASLRSYRAGSSIGAMEQAEYIDAAANGVRISTNSWGNWIRGHSHQTTDSDDSYDVGSQFYDAVISGRQSDGTPSGLAGQISIFASAGNQGRPERHSEQVAANGQYDVGETIYQDDDDDGIVSAGDDLLLGAAQPNGTALVNFTVNERHDETVNSYGTYNSNEGIYLDADATLTVSPGDTRIVVPLGSPYVNGSIVAAGDTDDGMFLRQFMLWGNVRIPNSAKNTIEVASYESDTGILSEFSSRGPTNDGRYKPDIAAPGCQTLGDGGVTSTLPGNGYGVKCGTSMSTPAAAGIAALLDEWYRTACAPSGPTPDIVRALMLHSAEDQSNIPNVGNAYFGPDFAFGYGRVRAQQAVDLMPSYLQGSVAALGSTSYNVTIGVMDSLKVTLVWDDPPWVGSSAPSAVTGLLQNDLDLLLIAPDGTQYAPWLANAADPSVPASRAIIAAANPVPVSAEDHRNNVEQVVVDNAMAGTWTIQVTVSGLNLPPQNYILVSEALPPNTTNCTANPAADIWVKDNPTDDGTVPSTGAMYLGTDIWNRNAADGLTNDAHQNPEFGQTNYLYARVRNSSAIQDVKATTVDAWIGTLAIGLVWPDAFTHVGRFHVPNLVPGEVRIVGPIEWPPPAVGHYCMYTRVQSSQDPITFAETTSVWTNANNSNNIAYRNMTIVDLASSKSISFLVRNIMKDDKDVDIVINIPKELLEIGEVQMKLSPQLEQRWPLKNRNVQGLVQLKDRFQIIRDVEMPAGMELERRLIMAPNATEMQKRRLVPKQLEMRLPIYKVGAQNTILQGVRMEPKQAERMTLTFSSKQTKKAVYHVHITQKVNGKTVGGILFVIRTGYINTN